MSRNGGEERSLAGLTVAVTRPAAQAGGLSSAISALGGEPLACPTIRIVDPADPEILRRAARTLADYDWVVFTSVNGVARFLRELEAPGALWPASTRAAAIGPATAAALRAHGVEPTAQPDEFVAEAVARALSAEHDLAGAKVLMPRAKGARPVLRERLEALGARVDEVEAYRSEPDVDGIEALERAVRDARVDVVAFTAASTVQYYVDAAGPDLGDARVAVIGPITAAAARLLGVRVDIEARDYTTEGLLTAILEFYRGSRV